MFRVVCFLFFLTPLFCFADPSGLPDQKESCNIVVLGKKAIQEQFSKAGEKFRGAWNQAKNSKDPIVSTKNPLRSLLHIVPVIPLSRFIEDPSKKYFVLIEQPLLGIPAGLMSIAILKSFFWVLALRENPDLAYPHLVTVDNFVMFLESYIAYNLLQIFRSGNSVDKDLSKSDTLFLNWFYSFVGYSAISAFLSPHLHNGLQSLFDLNPASTVAQHVTPIRSIRQLSITLFSGLWPLISQHVGIRLSRKLFYDFPQQDVIKRLKDPNDSPEAVISDIENGVGKFSSFTADQRTSTVSWVKTLTHGLPPGQIRTKHLWLAKTGLSTLVAVSMQTLYWLARIPFAGDDRLEIPTFAERVMGETPDWEQINPQNPPPPQK